MPPARARGGVLLQLPAFPGRACACAAFSPRSLSTEDPGHIPGAGALEVTKTEAEDVPLGPANGTRKGARSPGFRWRGRMETDGAGSPPQATRRADLSAEGAFARRQESAQGHVGVRAYVRKCPATMPL